MRRKNALEYIILALFIMCMGLALSAALEYSTTGTERPFLLQGIWVLALTLMTLGVFVMVRLVNKAAPHIGERKKDIAATVCCVLLIAAGVLVRMAVIRYVPIEPESDYETYYRIADELLHDTLLTPQGDLDRRYIAMYPHTIGFPMLVLVPAYRLFGQSLQTALYANLACSTVTLILGAHLSRRLMGRTGSVLVTFLLSFWPSHVLYSNIVATEQSFTMMLLVAAELIASVLPRERGSLYDRAPGKVMAELLLLGIVLGVAGALRPMAIVLLAAFALVQLMQGGDPEGRIPMEGMRFALRRGWFCVLLVLIPYFATGAIISRTISDLILEEPAGGLTASGYNMMVGVNAQSEGRWNEEDSDFFGGIYDETGDANAAHRACMQVAIQRITGEPENVLNLLVYKFRDLWQTDDFGIDWNLQWKDHQGTLTDELKADLEAVRPVGRFLYMSVLLFSLLGAVEAWRGERAPRPMLMVSMLFFLGTALAHMLLETQVRYHYNMLPFLILMAVMDVVQWRERLAVQPACRVVYQVVNKKEDSIDDHTHFDMRKALEEGHITVSVTQAYEKLENAAPAGDAAPSGEGPEPADGVPEAQKEKDTELSTV